MMFPSAYTAVYASIAVAFVRHLADKVMFRSRRGVLDPYYLNVETETGNVWKIAMFYDKIDAKRGMYAALNADRSSVYKFRMVRAVLDSGRASLLSPGRPTCWPPPHSEVADGRDRLWDDCVVAIAKCFR